MKLVVATRNAHKTEEIRAILREVADTVVDLSAFPDRPSPEETGGTFEENAAIKALALSEVLGPGTLVLSDDSGLEVDALNGAPGVYSARYASESDAPDAANRRKLLEELEKKGARGKRRSGRFRCVMVLARGAEIIGTFHGAIEGIIANREKGAGGFGYDPVFIPEGHCETFGQLPPEVKNALSHRARALEKVKEALGAL